MLSVLAADTNIQVQKMTNRKSELMPMTIPEIAIPFGAFLVNWMIPKIIERIASGIFTKEKNKTNAIMPSTMDAIPNPRPPEETSLTLQF